MNTRLVMWGEIGTDRKALVTFSLEEEEAKIHIYAFPRENVTKEIQDALFVEWKNGGDFAFPETAVHWEIDANSDTILPENMKVDRLDMVIQSQHKWGKKLMSSKINQLLTDEVKLLEEKAIVVAEYDQSLWDKAKTQWEKIASYQKKNEISWEQTTVLKDKINSVFEAIKAVKRINNENDDQANAVLVKSYYKRIEDLQSKLIYEDQWKFIFNELKKIQAELKDATSVRWNHKRTLYNQVNAIFDDLRKYRMTEVISKTKERINQLSKILEGLNDSIARDNESYQMQVDKMQHYTRGKLSTEELQTRFGFLLERTKEKETKVEGIKQTIVQLKGEIEKEKQQQADREAQQLRKEQEEVAKQEEFAAKKLIDKQKAQDNKAAKIAETLAKSIEKPMLVEDILVSKDEVIPVDELPASDIKIEEVAETITENESTISDIQVEKEENIAVAEIAETLEKSINEPILVEDILISKDEVIPVDELPASDIKTEEVVELEIKTEEISTENKEEKTED